MPKAKLPLSEQIEKARDGRPQRWIIKKLKEEHGIELTDVQFSNKKNFSTFTEEELQAISEILNTELVA